MLCRADGAEHVEGRDRSWGVIHELAGRYVCIRRYGGIW
jgi:hypothetical protein